MKKHLVITALTLMASAAQAEIFTCTFTEPFVNVTYTTGTQQLKIESFDDGVHVAKGAGFLIRGLGRYEVLQNGKLLMTISHTGQGSDGMSDFVYPFEVKAHWMGSAANNGIGGCESLALKKYVSAK